MIFVGVDWAEDHHDVCVLDDAGDVLARKRIPDTLAGVRALHELLAPLAEEPNEVIVGIEKERGLIVTAMLGANYRVYALNPMSVARYRERHVTSGSKSDPGDAKVIADVVRTDRHNHREAAGDSENAQAIKVLARAHQSAICRCAHAGPRVTALARQDHLGASPGWSCTQPRAHREEDPIGAARRAAARTAPGRARLRHDHERARRHDPRLRQRDRDTRSDAGLGF
jgi:hypothetical protein